MSQLTKAFDWNGRVDDEDGQLGKRWHQVITQESSVNGLGLIGFACDLGVAVNKGRVGAKGGPEVIRASLANLAWHVETSAKDHGDVVADNDLAAAQLNYATLVAESIAKHDLTIGLGGGHEIAWGSFQGLRKYLDSLKTKSRVIGIINIDAHFDLRLTTHGASSGTPFRQIAEYCFSQGEQFNYSCLGISKTANTKALFQYAKETGTRYLLDSDTNLANARSLLSPMLEDIDELYLTICLDAFSGDIAPGVSSPSVYGIDLKFVIDLIQWLAGAQSTFDFQWRLADIAELNPVFDNDNMTAKLAARLIAELTEAKFT